MKSRFYFILIILSLITCKSQDINLNTVGIETEDLKLLIGEWNGSLTYLDYQSNKPYTMPANLLVEKGKDDYQLIINNIYPNETQANDSAKLNISKDGLLLNKRNVISRKKLNTGTIEIITQYSGKDDGKKALIRNSYLLSDKSYSSKKEVQFKDSEQWILRSEFSYVRKN